MPTSTKHKRRILITLRRLGTGGIERATLTLANAMAAEGHEVHLLVLKGQPERLPGPVVIVHCRDLDREQRWGIKGMSWHLLSRLALTPLMPGSGFVWQGMRCSQAFEAFITDTEARYGHFDLILIRGQGAFELLWKFHDPRAWLVVEAVTGRFSGRLSAWLTRCLYQRHKVICVSQGVERELALYLEKHGTRLAECRVIHNAVPIHQLGKMAKEPCQPEIPRPYLVHVGRLVPVKKQTLLLDAYAKARELGLSLPLVIIGDGSERRALEALANQLNIRESVHFLGALENPYPWMANATAFVLSSRFEGLGLVLIEALALGTQCVATDVPGGIREVLVEEQRRLLASPNADSLATKLCEAVDTPVVVRPEWAERFAEQRIVSAFIDLIPASSQT
ncbi:glycosyltransferase [Halomonas ventosae]|uniref:Glycosyltransferase involved in cell wall biosynthesis n=1 Tax=Halomonas ventosae TaxID=229007 RepID=A0A2T0VB04_9GAMM|nr:glycosyltransferase [Halomonas ventosae]PRY67380.1 glycosyltransferase involved in cell wall biosynthesis [Halomonas ventosae]